MLTKTKLRSWITWIYAILFALLPFSLPLTFASHQLMFPSELLMAILSLLLLIYFLRYGWWSTAFYRHPLTLLSFVFISWMAICVPFSSQWKVSLKYWIVASAHWWIFYHGIGLVLVNKLDDFLSLFKKYACCFTLILIYAWYTHAQYDFRIDASVLVARPFYFDHAMYSAVLLLLVPFIPFFHFYKKTTKRQWINWLWASLMLLGVYLSFSRAAWLSAIAAAALLILIYLFRIPFKHLLSLFAITIIGILFFMPALSQKLVNNQAESKKGTLWEQFISSANVTTDVSNLERLNRYSCAIRMTNDRPWTGFGPGTFQFAYLTYQKPEEMTRISVTVAGEHQPGRGGGAHSEYLQAFAEMGIVGGLCWIGILLSVLWSALNQYHLRKDKIILALLFGLTTFFVHALFNNFLHHGKIAALVWGSLALLSLLNTSHTEDII